MHMAMCEFCTALALKPDETFSADFPDTAIRMPNVRATFPSLQFGDALAIGIVGKAASRYAPTAARFASSAAEGPVTL